VRLAPKREGSRRLITTTFESRELPPVQVQHDSKATDTSAEYRGPRSLSRGNRIWVEGGDRSAYM
jgi:hypothetical protein